MLNPRGAYFDRVTLHAIREVDPAFVTIDKYALLGETSGSAEHRWQPAQHGLPPCLYPNQLRPPHPQHQPVDLRYRLQPAAQRVSSMEARCHLTTLGRQHLEPLQLAVGQCLEHRQ